MSKDIKIKFDCSGFNAPAYSCSKPGDNSGFYVQSTDYDTLTKQVAELEFSLDDRDCYIADADMKNEEAAKRVAELEAALLAIKNHQQALTPSGFEFSGVWQVANKALEENQ